VTTSAARRISVVVPLQDERQAGVDCIRAWTRGQTVPGETHEVIALAPGEDPALEAAVRPLLRPGDRWVTEPGASEYELFQRGAREARGEYLFITEAHCVPEPDCLEAMLAELDRTGAPGVRGESVPEARGELGRLESDTFEAALAPEKEPGHWRKVLIHSLAIRRDLYLEAGGLPPRYGDFSPWVLAIALAERGERLLYSPRPAVRHVYDGDLDHLGSHVRDWNRGQLLFCAEAPRAYWGRYVPPLTEWQARLALSRRGTFAALRAALALRHRGALAPALRHLVVALAGPRGVAEEARVRAAAAARSARRARADGPRRVAFLDFWRSTARRGALEGLAQARPTPEAGGVGGAIDLTGEVSGWTIGLYETEAPGDRRYRWTDSLVLLRVRVPSGARRARLALEPARPGGRPPRPAVAVDGARVPASYTHEAIEFELAGGGERTIALAFEPYRPARDGLADPRQLGVAVRSLSFERGGG
jgi:GT2 family glycosyltransferase